MAYKKKLSMNYFFFAGSPDDAVNRVRVIARVINVSSCLFIPFTVFLHLHCLVLSFSCLYCLFIYCSSGLRFLIQYITCYCHSILICILLICITDYLRAQFCAPISIL